MNITEEQVLEALKNVDDPDLHKDIVTLGMVKDVEVDGNKVNFTVELTTPACPMKELIHRACVNAIKNFISKEAEVKVKMSSKVTSQQNESKEVILPNVKNIIAVASGKGGVGKSTISANLAVGLAKMGAKVGLVDADIYGPSVPTMFDVVNQKPGVTIIDEKQYILPVESYGVKVLSIGLFAAPNQAIPWRGPMASKALRQLFSDAHWGEIDYMVVDLPPGTGDIHLTFVADIPITGVVIVTTPQEVALADARKALAMFQMPAINIPVLGVVENMSYFTPEELPNNKYYLFGKEGGKQFAESANLPLLGQIPIVQSIREAGDAGRPAIMQDGSISSIAFMEMVKNIAQQVAIKNASTRLVTDITTN